MAPFFLLVGLYVAWITKVVAGGNCGSYLAGCAAKPGTEHNPSPSLLCLVAACTADECCRPQCLTLTDTCAAGRLVQNATFCVGAACTTAECCTITAGRCQIDHCNAVNGSWVLKTNDLPTWCSSANCFQEECCDMAAQCQPSDCIGNMTANVLNEYCAGPVCVPSRECCNTTVTITPPLEDATSIAFPDVAYVRVGDQFTFYDSLTRLSTHTVTGVTVGSGRRLAGGPGTIHFSPPVPAVTANALRNSGTPQMVISPGGDTAAVSDPITFYRGHKTKFWLPYDKLSLLLETNDIKLYVSVLEGPSEDLQWFGRFLVFTSDGSKVCEIDVNRHEIMSPKSFKQIVFKLGDSDTPLPAQKGTYGSSNGKVALSISTMRWNTPGDLNFTDVQELVYFETEDLVFMILPSHAGNEFPTSKALALKYMHLDFIVREMKDEKHFGGILPELWGLKPRSKEARAMLTKPSQSRALSGDNCGTCNGAPFWE